MPDAVLLDSLSGAKKTRDVFTTGNRISFKILIALFLIFIFVVSDVFTGNIVSVFKGSVLCRAPTPYGVVIQGIFLVIFYILAFYLIEGKII